MARLFVGSEDVDEARAEAKKKIAARNKALSIIDDARAKYIKEKTRARSKKAAMERDAYLSSGHFDDLRDYERRQDINESYGFDCISEAERDRLEDLWDERERILNHTEKGIYRDDVTEALHEAWVAIADLWEDKVEYADKLEQNLYKYIDTDTFEEINTKENK